MCSTVVRVWPTASVLSSDVIKAIPDQGSVCYLGQVFAFLFIVPDVCSVSFLNLCFLVVSTVAVDCLERLVSEMICYVLSGTLHPTHLPVMSQSYKLISRFLPCVLEVVHGCLF